MGVHKNRVFYFYIHPQRGMIQSVAKQYYISTYLHTLLQQKPRIHNGLNHTTLGKNTTKIFFGES